MESTYPLLPPNTKKMPPCTPRTPLLRDTCWPSSAYRDPQCERWKNPGAGETMDRPWEPKWHRPTSSGGAMGPLDCLPLWILNYHVQCLIAGSWTSMIWIALLSIGMGSQQALFGVWLCWITIPNGFLYVSLMKTLLVFKPFCTRFLTDPLHLSGPTFLLTLWGIIHQRAPQID